MADDFLKSVDQKLFWGMFHNEMYISKTFFKQNQKVSILNNIAEFFFSQTKTMYNRKISI